MPNAVVRRLRYPSQETGRRESRPGPDSGKKRLLLGSSHRDDFFRHTPALKKATHAKLPTCEPGARNSRPFLYPSPALVPSRSDPIPLARQSQDLKTPRLPVPKNNARPLCWPRILFSAVAPRIAQKTSSRNSPSRAAGLELIPRPDLNTSCDTGHHARCCNLHSVG